MRSVLFLIIGVLLFGFELKIESFLRKIPLKYVYNYCGGENISPALLWSDSPKNAKSFAIVMHDPDAPKIHGWFHWIVVNIPKNVNYLPKGAGNKGNKYFTIGNELYNDYSEIGYGGPCPPPGKPHRYVFCVYALDTDHLKTYRLPYKNFQEILKHAVSKACFVSLYKRGWR